MNFFYFLYSILEKIILIKFQKNLPIKLAFYNFNLKKIFKIISFSASEIKNNNFNGFLFLLALKYIFSISLFFLLPFFNYPPLLKTKFNAFIFLLILQMIFIIDVLEIFFSKEKNSVLLINRKIILNLQSQIIFTFALFSVAILMHSFDLGAINLIENFFYKILIFLFMIIGFLIHEGIGPFALNDSIQSLSKISEKFFMAKTIDLVSKKIRIIFFSFFFVTTFFGNYLLIPFFSYFFLLFFFYTFLKIILVNIFIIFTDLFFIRFSYDYAFKFIKNIVIASSIIFFLIIFFTKLI